MAKSVIKGGIRQFAYINYMHLYLILDWQHILWSYQETKTNVLFEKNMLTQTVKYHF